MTDKEYYIAEIGTIDTKGEYPVALKMWDANTGNETKTLALNTESAEVLAKFLYDHFGVVHNVDYPIHV